MTAHHYYTKFQKMAFICFNDHSCLLLKGLLRYYCGVGWWVLTSSLPHETWPEISREASADLHMVQDTHQLERAKKH